jgi:hypothetical protein
MHNKRKHHNKYTQKHIHNNTGRVHKRKLRHTRHHPRRNITHKQRGGEPSSWVSSLTNSFAKKNETPSQVTIIEKAAENKSFAEQSQKYGNIAQGTILSGVAVATTIGNTAVAGLAATGVGIPLAGILAIALIFAKAITDMTVASLELRSVMYDALNILTNCYALNEYIEFMQGKIKTSSSSIKKYNIENAINNPAIDDIKKSIANKLTELITFILKISTKEMLEILTKQITDAKITEIIKNENDKRKKTLAFIDTLTRIADRDLYAEKTMNKIVRNLTIINGNFILLKSHFDTTLDYFERKLDAVELKQFWSDVETNQNFTTYLNGKSISHAELTQQVQLVTSTKTKNNDAISLEARDI